MCKLVRKPPVSDPIRTFGGFTGGFLVFFFILDNNLHVTFKS